MVSTLIGIVALLVGAGGVVEQLQTSLNKIWGFGRRIMESRVKLLGHPVHQMLIVFPLLATAVVFDCIYLAGGGVTMAVVAYWMIAAGIIGGLLAAPFGWINWFEIPPNTRAKSVGFWHGVEIQ